MNLQLSGSERLLVGVRALDDGGRFTSYFFEHPDPTLDGEFRDEVDADLEFLFFEGDFGEIFPNLDKEDFGTLRLWLLRRPAEPPLPGRSADQRHHRRHRHHPQHAAAGQYVEFPATFFYGWDNVNTSAGADATAISSRS